MADTKITALAAIATVDPAADVLPIVDISDTSMAASGTTKKVTSNQILGSGGVATLASATITGDLTVDTTTLKVDSTNNYVGIGTASPVQSLTISGEASVRVGDLIYWNAYYNAGFKARAAGYAAYIGEAGTGDFTIANTSASAAGAGSALAFLDRYRITNGGVFTWENAGNVAGTAMTLNSTGLGIGAVPSAWSNPYKCVQLSGGSLSVYPTTDLYISQNAYNSGGWKRVAAGYASQYIQTNSEHRFLIAGTDPTVDSAIAFTQAMTLDASGNLLVGTTSALQISNNPAVTSRIANLGTGSKGSVILRENEASAYWGGNLFLQKVRGTSTAVQSGDILGTVAFGGFDGTNYVNTAVIQTSVTGAVSAGVVPVKIQVVATSGGVELTNTATSWAAISDERLKDIIEPINNAVAKVGLLRSVIGKYKSDSEGTRRSFLIAQDVQSALPEAVGGNEDSMTVRYTEVIPLLVAAIKELTARVQTLEAK